MSCGGGDTVHPATECAAGYCWENTCTGEKAVCACKANKVCTGYVTAVCYAIMGAGKMGGFFMCMGVKVVCSMPGQCALACTCTGDTAVCACKAYRAYTGYVTAVVCYEGYETVVCHSGVMGAGGAWEAQEGDRSSCALRDVTWEARARATRVCVLVWVYLCSLAR